MLSMGAMDSKASEPMPFERLTQGIRPRIERA